MQLGWKTYVPKIYLKLGSLLLTHTPAVRFEQIGLTVTLLVGVRAMLVWNILAGILHIMSEVFSCFLQSS
jgi:hypothetical protein